MVHTRSPFMDYFVSAFFSTPDEYWRIYEGALETNVLVDYAISNVIHICEHSLRTGHELYQLDRFLYGMLTECPHPDGKRHIAVALQITFTKGEAAVVEFAKIWMDNLFLPIFALSNPAQSGLSDGESRENVNMLEQDFGIQVAEREEHRCAITKMVGAEYLRTLALAGRAHESPVGPRSSMAVAQIIPSMLIASEQCLTDKTAPGKKDNITTCDLFRAWTQIQTSDLAGELINSPANGIFMTVTEYDDFGQFMLYFDKDVYPHSPNKYQARYIVDGLVLSNGATSADVEFSTVNGIEPPKPLFLKIHASFAKVLHVSGVDRYYDSLERVSQTLLKPNPEYGSALLTYKVSVLAM